MDQNPCTSIKKLKGSIPYDPWSWEDIFFFRDNVSVPQLWWVAALALYTGQRKSDVLKMGKNHIKDGLIRIKQDKTDKPLWLPIHKDLQEIVENIPKSESTTILTNTKGRPWKSGFGASWSKEMAKNIFGPLRDKGLVFHGFRKSAVICLLESGCTSAEVSAVTGQSMQMDEHYAIQVNQKKLARNAILKWEGATK